MLIVVSWQPLFDWHFPPLEHSVNLTKLANHMRKMKVCVRNKWEIMNHNKATVLRTDNVVL